MASTKFVISEEERSAADILIKAETEKKPAFQGHGTRTQGLMWNYVKDSKTLYLHDQHNGSENAVVSYPTSIYTSKYGQPSTFMHEGPLPIGSKGGVVYVDGQDSTARKWLVAFDAANSRVYVEAGPIGPVDWNVVEVKLAQSGPISEYEDPIFHGRASGEIRIEPYISLMFARFTN